MEKKELESIEPAIEKLESELAVQQAVLAKGGSNYTELAEAQERIDEIEMEILEKMERQEFLMEKE